MLPPTTVFAKITGNIEEITRSMQPSNLLLKDRGRHRWVPPPEAGLGSVLMCNDFSVLAGVQSMQPRTDRLLPSAS
jgi:hypothetical protein